MDSPRYSIPVLLIAVIQLQLVQFSCSQTTAPSIPSISVIRQATSLTFSFTQPEGEVVDNYRINVSYVGDCDEIGNLFQDISLLQTRSEQTFSNLQKFSKYLLTVVAMNEAGSSEPSSLLATTIPTAPVGTVENVMVTTTPSSIYLQWDRVACMYQNSEITGYIVSYGPPGTNDIIGTNTRNFTASGLIPRVMYIFQIVPTSASGNGPTHSVSVSTRVSSAVQFQLDGQFYPNNSVLDPSHIGLGEFRSLLCLTDIMECCQSTHTGTGMGAGQWYFSSDSSVPFGIFNHHYTTQGPSVVRLNRQPTAVTQSGLYRCEVPSAGGMVNIYIGLYPPNQGVLSVYEVILFDRAALTLTCTSTGGPASEVVWTRNGEPVSTGYSLSQTVTDTARGQYENVLRAVDASDLVGNFSCIVRNIRGVSNTAEVIPISTDFAVVLSGGATVTAGTSHSLECRGIRDSSVLGAILEVEWFGPDGSPVSVTGETSTTELTLVSTLLFPSLSTSHAGEYTCRVNLTVPGTAIFIHKLRRAVLRALIPPPTVTVTTPRPVYRGTYHTFNCVASYNLTVVDTPVSLVFFWSGPGGGVLNGEGSFVANTTSESSLTLTPVNQPSVSSGGYTCNVTVQSENTFIMSGSSSNSVTLSVLAAPAPLVESGVPVRSGRCGEVTAISCSAEVVDNFATRPNITWQRPGGETVDSDETLDSGLIVSVSGEYTCVACVSVESVGITELCNTTTVSIVSEAPDRVTHLSCVATGSLDTLEVVWRPPSDGQAVLSYQVEVRKYTLLSGQITTTVLRDAQITTERTTIPDTAVGVRYRVSVEAGSGSGCGRAQSVECYSEEGTPPPVTITDIVRLNGTAMNVSWTPVNIVEARGFISFIVTYTVSSRSRVRRQAESVGVAGDQSSVVIGGLDPMSQYDVTVVIRNAGGVSQASPPERVDSVPSALFQLRLININNCPEWVDQGGRIVAVTNAMATEVESHCQCGFTVDMISAPLFRCFPQSSNAVTLRAKLIDAVFASAVRKWIQESGLIPVQNILIEVDKTCQVVISSLTDTECVSKPTASTGTTHISRTTNPMATSDNNVGVIGGVVGGITMLFIIAVIVVVVAMLVLRNRKNQLTVSKTNKHELPPASLQGMASTADCQMEPYEIMEMGHQYEEVSKFQQRPGRVKLEEEDYETIATPTYIEPLFLQNSSTVVKNPQDPPANPLPASLQTKTESDFEFTGCVAYETTSHTPPTNDDPLYSN